MRARTGTSGRSISSYTCSSPASSTSLAQDGGDTPGDVGGFRQPARELQVEAAQRDLGQTMARVGGIEQVGVEHGIVAQARQLDAARGEGVDGFLVVVDGLGELGIRQGGEQTACRRTIVQLDGHSLARRRRDSDLFGDDGRGRRRRQRQRGVGFVLFVLFLFGLERGGSGRLKPEGERAFAGDGLDHRARRRAPRWLRCTRFRPTRHRGGTLSAAR